MNRKLFAAALALLVTLSACSSSREYTSSAFDSGYDSGYSDGYEAGRQAALEDMPDIEDIIEKVAKSAEEYTVDMVGMSAADAGYNIDQYQNPDPRFESISWQEYMDSIDALFWYHDYFESKTYWGDFSYD